MGRDQLDGAVVVSLLPADRPEDRPDDVATGRWADALDELETWIDRAVSATSDTDALEEAASGAWAAPEDLGPLPRHLAARATAVLARLDAAERELSERRDATQAELTGRRQRPRTTIPSPGPDATYIDRIA